MKRYVIEFTNDILRKYDHIEIPKEAIWTLQEISRVVCYCERGLVTEIEAVKKISELYWGLR